jgi:hypothetical protein
MKLKIDIKVIIESPPISAKYYEVKFNDNEPEMFADKIDIITAIGNEFGIEITDLTYNDK